MDGWGGIIDTSEGCYLRAALACVCMRNRQEQKGVNWRHLLALILASNTPGAAFTKPRTVGQGPSAHMPLESALAQPKISRTAHVLAQ